MTISYTVSGFAPNLISVNSSSLLIGNFSSNANPGSNISMLSRFNVVTPRSSRTFTITFTTFYLSGTTQYGMETRTNSYNCPTGTLSPANVIAGTTFINTNTTVTLNIALANAIYAGSYIGVTFPQYLTAIVGSSCSTNNSNISCAVSASNYSNLSVSGTVAASSGIMITFNMITTAQ